MATCTVELGQRRRIDLRREAVAEPAEHSSAFRNPVCDGAFVEPVITPIVYTLKTKKAWETALLPVAVWRVFRTPADRREACVWARVVHTLVPHIASVYV